MEAKELMIGDCVSVYGQNNDITQKPHWYNRKVTADWLVNMEKLDLLNEKLAKRGIFVGHPQIGDVEHIPLTPDILKANGFVKSSYDGSWYIPKHITPTSCHLYVEVFSDDLGFDPYEETLKVICHNVHFLQHALRLNGMTDIADNFKV